MPELSADVEWRSFMYHTLHIMYDNYENIDSGSIDGALSLGIANFTLK